MGARGIGAFENDGCALDGFAAEHPDGVCAEAIAQQSARGLG